MKLLASKLALFFPVLLIALCLCCAKKNQEAVKTPHKTATQEETEPNVVATISDYTITKEELKKRFLKELHPHPLEFRSKTETIDTKSVLLKMIAEKAMVIEARKQNLHEEENFQKVIKVFKEKKFVNLLLSIHLKGKMTVTDQEIDDKIKSDPKLDRARAKAMLAREKSGKLVELFYNELYQEFHVKKLNENFYKAANIHQRLLYQPKKPRSAPFIRISQTKEELTQKEKDIVLATYDKGTITLKDWFYTLCEMSPPSRPKDLNTPKGVEKLLDRALKMPIFIAQARLFGINKDENILKQAREYGDSMLFNKAKRGKTKDIKGPINEEKLIAYFNKNKEVFGTQNTLTIDQIWCQDLKTARKAKTDLDNGKDFESVRQTYSLVKKANPYDISFGDERLFFKDLWNGEPNEVVGPLKGFYGTEMKWRIAKILEKKPGVLKEYSDDMKRNIEMKMIEEQRYTTLRKYRQELLEEYSYQIYAERIRDIDPLDIP